MEEKILQMTVVPRACVLGLTILLRRDPIDCGVQTFVLGFGEWRLEIQLKLKSLLSVWDFIFTLPSLPVFSSIIWHISEPSLPEALGLAVEESQK